MTIQAEKKKTRIKRIETTDNVMGQLQNALSNLNKVRREERQAKEIR